MKVGMGIITAGNRQISSNVTAKTDPSTIVHVQLDANKLGPGHTRNDCMRYLLDKGCDYIFMFDDDCYPIMKGWEEYFITQSLSYDIHFFGLPEAFKSILEKVDGEIAYWQSIVGCFSFQTRRFMEKVGFYNGAYKRYGFEDAGRNRRALRSGLCGSQEFFTSPVRAPSYIYSEDVYADNPTPNLSREEKEKYIVINRPIWIAEVNSEQLYYPHHDEQMEIQK